MSSLTKKVPYMSEEEIAIWIIKHNPENVSLYYTSLHEPVIKTKISLDYIKLPDGCYYNFKNGITNKHNTISGIYSCLAVEYF